MKTNRVYIGEAYKKIDSKSDIRIGYIALYYNPKNKKYRLLRDKKHYFETNKTLINQNEKYISEDSLIPYEMFAKKHLFGNNIDVIDYNCRKKITELIETRAKLIYNYNYTEDSSIVEDKPTEENETSNIDSAKPTEQNSKQEEKYLSISDISVSRLNDNVLIASIIGVFQNFSSQEILNKISISSTSGTPTIYEDVNLNNNSFLFKIDITDCDGDLNISINDYYFYQDISSIV